MIFCTKCGQQNDDAARSCANCGATFGGQAGSVPFTTGGPYQGGAQQQPQQPGGGPWSTPQYGAQPPSQPMQPVYGRPGLMAIGEKRDPVMVIVFTFLTCGFYGLWWWYTMGTEVKNALNRQDINPGMDILFGFLTCGIYFIYMCYKYPQLLLEMQDRVGIARNDISMVTLLLAVFGLQIVSGFMIQTELNKIWDAAMMRR